VLGDPQARRLLADQRCDQGACHTRTVPLRQHVEHRQLPLAHRLRIAGRPGGGEADGNAVPVAAHPEDALVGLRSARGQPPGPVLEAPRDRGLAEPLLAREGVPVGDLPAAHVDPGEVRCVGQGREVDREAGGHVACGIGDVRGGRSQLAHGREATCRPRRGRRGRGSVRTWGTTGRHPCGMLMGAISNASIRHGVGADDERCTMSLFLLEIEPAATTREGSQAVLDALRAAAGDTAPAELIESPVAADHSRLFTILEADDAEGAGTVVAELREVAGAVHGPDEVRLVGAELEEIKALRRGAGYLVEWDIPAEITMDQYLARKKANAPKYAQVPETS